MQPLDGFDVVLCRAEEPGNVGAVCRAMKTMGLYGLVLADCPEYPDEPVKTFALHAFDIYVSARRYPDLKAALEDCSLAAGFTRRTGRMRARDPLDIEAFAPLALDRGNRVCLVFGNERDGLSRDELALCDVAVRIPTSEAFPSLNLAQAVQIACWELARNRRSREGKRPREESALGRADSANRALLANAVEAIADDLAGMGFFKISGRPGFLRFLRSLLARAAVDARELEYFRAIFRKAASISARKDSATLTPASDEARVSEKIPARDAPEGDRPCDG